MLNVMIVDDDEVVRRGLSTVIKWSDFGAKIIASCENGQAAIETLAKQKIDLVIADIKMPLVDGLELSEHICNHYGDTQIVLLSAYDEFEYAIKAIQSKVRSYIVKPINREKVKQLTQIINEVSNERKCATELKLLLNNYDFRKNFHCALEENDTKYIRKVLTVDEMILLKDLQSVKDYYISILNMVLEFARDSDAGFFSGEELINELMQLGDINSVKTIANKRIMSVLHLTTIKKRKNTHMITEYIKDYIRSEYMHQGISASRISEKLGITVSHCGKVFKEHENTTITKYINSYRIKKAYEFLENTNIPISKITENIGYTEQSYFARIFKKETGVTPAEYRHLKSE